MGTRICHADANTDADSNGVHTKTYMSLLTFGDGGGGGGGGGGWHHYLKDMLRLHIYFDTTRVYIDFGVQK